MIQETPNRPANAVIVGAGPCGLFQAFQLGLQGIHCHILEAASTPGGQCNELYADKPIYDIPGIPHILAGDLSQQLLKQIQPFDPAFSFNTRVINIERIDNGLFELHTNNKDTIVSRYVIIATGAGAFTPVKMRLDGVDTFEGKQLHYHSHPDTTKKNVTVIGDTQSAVDTVIRCAGKAASINYVHRKRRMIGSQASLATLQQLCDSGDVNIFRGKATDLTVQNNRLLAVLVAGSDNQIQRVDTDVLLARLGNSPKVQNFADWNIDTERNLINVSCDSFQSNLDGLYVIGDVNNYPGKRKLILCGFHEATLVAFAIAQKTYPEKPVHTQYTTTSTELLARLGVSPR